MNTLISEFINLAIEHGKTKNEGNYKIGNKIHAKLMRIVARIKCENESIRKQFYVLMYHEDPYVRLWSSSSLLKTFEQEALTTLKKIKENQDIPALDAEIIISAWENGVINDIENWNQ
jgi:hypothetical protein